MRKLTVILFTALFPLLVHAAPSLTSATISGTIADGETIIISNGSGFGSTGPTVQFFDDMELGTNNSRIGNGDSTDAQVGEWRDLSARSMENYPTYSTNAAHSGTRAFRLNHNEQYDCGTGGVWGGPSTSASNTWYISYWVFLPAGQVTPGATDCGGAGPNWKVWWLTTDDYFQNDYASEIISSPPSAMSAGWVDGSQSRIYVDYTSFTFTRGVWQRHEIYLVGSTSSGSITMWYLNNGSTKTQLGTASGRTLDNGTTGWQYLHLPGFGRKDSNSNTYYDDIYVATGSGARARVEIGNNATYTSCTNLAVCTPTSWSDTSITAVVRAGSFTTGTAYLFVTDSSGVTSAGKEITFGEESSTPAPPTLSNVTISNGRVQ